MFTGRSHGQKETSKVVTDHEVVTLEVDMVSLEVDSYEVVTLDHDAYPLANSPGSGQSTTELADFIWFPCRKWSIFHFQGLPRDRFPEDNRFTDHGSRS